MTEKIDTIILAGGLGTRIRSAVSDMPKVLAPVNNRPFLDIILSFLSKSKFIINVVIAIGYMAEKIKQTYKDCDKYNFNIYYSEEKILLGTGGAIKKALQFTESENVLIMNGDSYVEFNLKDLIYKHLYNGSDVTIVIKEVMNSNRYGRVKLNSNDRVITFEEKNPETVRGFVNAGVYLIKRNLFDQVKTKKVISLERDLLPEFINEKVYGYKTNGKFIDIGTPETYTIADKYLK